MLSPKDLVSKFVGQKLSKVRWVPGNALDFPTGEFFVTGGWDDEECLLQMWSFREAGFHGDSAQGALATREPVLISSVTVPYSITDLEFSNPDTLLVADEGGNMTTFLVDTSKPALLRQDIWTALHKFKGNECSPCTTISTRYHDIVTGGEDGRLCSLRLDRPHHVQSSGIVDGSCINALSFYARSTSVLLGNSFGQLKLVDLGSNETRPSKIFSIVGSKVPVLSLSQHPSQPHIFLVGRGDGTIDVWDLRQDQRPVTILEAHSEEVWEVKFHDRYPDSFFSCSQDGRVLHCDGSAIRLGDADQKSIFSPAKQDVSSTCVWLSVNAYKHKLVSVMCVPDSRQSVNSIDITSKTLLCGTDSESLLLVKDFMLR